MKRQINYTHVEYVNLLPEYREPHKLRGSAKVPVKLGSKQEGWA